VTDHIKTVWAREPVASARLSDINSADSQVGIILAGPSSTTRRPLKLLDARRCLLSTEQRAFLAAYARRIKADLGDAALLPTRCYWQGIEGETLAALKHLALARLPK